MQGQKQIINSKVKVVKVSKILKMLAEDGWVKVHQVGSHRQFRHPTKKAGEIPPSQDTYGVQVSLVFPDLETLRNFRGILDELEAGLKDRIKESEAQQVDSLPKED